MAIKINGLTTKTDPGEILDELRRSAERNNVLGLFIEGDAEMVTTAVRKIEDTSDGFIVHFERTDLHGYPVGKNPVALNQIKSVIPFQTLFSDPVYEAIRHRKASERDKYAA